jgi:glycosyltransferase involved in cell wall biosynthesis
VRLLNTRNAPRARWRNTQASTITAVILTLDEERNLPRALTSLPTGMHVFVLDAGSRDRTLQFARAAGATVVEREWTDFAEARRFALSQVATPWTLMIDADEALDDVLRDAIAGAAGDVDAYIVRRTTYFCGKPLRLWRNEPLLRLFRTHAVRLEPAPAAGGDAALHERWVCDGATGELPGTLLHYSYPDVATYRAKYARYTHIEAARMHGSAAALGVAAARAVASFGWLLLARGALLDGWRGLYVAFFSALYPVVVAYKALARG